MPSTLQRKSQILYVVLSFLILIPALLWPAIANHAPFFFVDTRTYVRTGDAAFFKLTHHHTEWMAGSEATAGQDKPVVETRPVSDTSEVQPVSRSQSLRGVEKRGIVLGRSPLYSAIAYLGAAQAKFWPTVVIQALFVAVSLLLLVSSLDLALWPTMLYLGLGLALLSEVAFYTSYLMPDIFGGLAVLGCIRLLSMPRRLRPAETFGWVAITLWSVLCHESCVVIAGCLVLLALLGLLVRRGRLNRFGLALVCGIVVFSVIFNALFVKVLRKQTGEEPLRLPLLEARLVADGPGTLYLRTHCGDPAPFVVCKYAQKFPVTAHQFLFAPEARYSVYEGAPYQERLAMSAEQGRVVLAIFRSTPLYTLRTMLRNFAALLINVRLDSFNYDPYYYRNMDASFPQSVLGELHGGFAYRHTAPIAAMNVAEYLFVIASLLYLAAGSLGRLPGVPLRREIRRMFLWALAATVINAAVCGIVSNNEARYEGRVMWVFPLLCIAGELERRRRAEALDLS